ncbi:YihY/virulence factor BrkB family protein [Salinactinospora qingdaonensis]|uniref:Inner membrane protein YhjD n=1 Tax=Salinactinospora qingdaonensis TaxID=702744 RepID=A0ABP7GK87_9ACTN
MATQGRGLTDQLRSYREAATETYWSLRRRHLWFDHVVRAYERYSDRYGSHLAASVTYFAFLSFFPLIALAFSLLGYVVTVNVEVRDYLEQGIASALPGLAEQLPLDQIAQARAGAGIIGLLGLLYTGLGAISALRQALHIIWLKDVSAGPNVVLAKLLDVVVVVALGLALAGSVALTSIAQAANQWLLDLVGGAALRESLAAVLFTRLLGLVVAIGADLGIFLLLFRRLSGTTRSWRALWRGALLAAVGFEILKALGALLISGTLNNPVYASFAVLVGLLVWINIVMRMLLFAAAWTATALAVPPPYEGAVPVGLPVTATAAEPARLVLAPDTATAAPAAAPRPPPQRPRRGRARVWLRRLATPVAVAAGVAIGLVWWRRTRAR